MASGSGLDPGDHTPEPVHGHGQREGSNAATSSPSDVAAEGGADASWPSPLPAAPADPPQERAPEQAGSGSGSRGTHGSSSAAAVDVEPQERVRDPRKGKGLASPSPPPPRSAGSSLSTTSPEGDWPFEDGAVGCKDVFEQMVQEGEKEKKKPVWEQGESSSSHPKEIFPPKKTLWSKFKKMFTRKRKVDRKGRQTYWEHVDRKTLPITKVGKHYRVTKDKPIGVNLDAYSRIRPVSGDGECFYRSFIFSYLEQVLDRQDTDEEQRLLGIVERVSTENTDLGWTSEFSRSCEAFKELIEKVMEWKSQGTSNNSYCKEKLLEFFNTYHTTNDIFAFLRLLAAIHICSYSGKYEQYITGLNESFRLKDWCFKNLIPARKFADHEEMDALATALEVRLRIERLYGVRTDLDTMYTGDGAVTVTLLYTGIHYDIIYPRASQIRCCW